MRVEPPRWFLMGEKNKLENKLKAQKKAAKLKKSMLFGALFSDIVAGVGFFLS